MLACFIVLKLKKNLTNTRSLKEGLLQYFSQKKKTYIIQQSHMYQKGYNALIEK